MLGDLAALARFGDDFASLPRHERYVAIESQGEGRMLAKPVHWSREGAEVLIELSVEPLAPRTDAARLSRDRALTMDKVPMDFDMRLEHVSGVESVAQRISTVLSICKDGWGAGAEIGSRVPEFHAQYGRKGIESFIKLELIRLATVPFWDSLDKKEHVVFGFIDRVLDVELLADPAPDWIRPRLRLRLNGVREPWEGYVNVCLSTEHLGPKADFFKGLIEP